MKKNKYLGLNKDKTKCCILESLADFSTIYNNRDQLETTDFLHSSTDWGGCDDIKRTLKLQQWKMYYNTIKLSKPLHFCGYDSDCGNSYGWNFDVWFIADVLPKIYIADEYKRLLFADIDNHLKYLPNDEVKEYLDYAFSADNLESYCSGDTGGFDYEYSGISKRLRKEYEARNAKKKTD